MSIQDDRREDGSDGIAPRVRQAMERRGMSIRRLATLTDTPYRTLQDYLRGAYQIPASKLARIADALDVSADWLLFARPATFNIDCLSDAAEELERDNPERPIGQWKRPYASRLVAHYFIEYGRMMLGDAATFAGKPIPPRRGQPR